MTQVSIIASTNQAFWPEGDAPKLFINDYLVHATRYNLADSDSVASPSVSDVKDREHCHKYILSKRAKYEKYFSVILNDYHRSDYPLDFWKKVFGLGLYRYISILYHQFQIYEKIVDPDKVNTRLLAQDLYKIPNDFENLLAYYAHSSHGQEQIFSMYQRCFYPSMDSIEIRPKVKRVARDSEPELPGHSSLVDRIWRIPIKDLFSKVFTKILKQRKPSIGIMESWFSADNIYKLLVQSRGRIQVISCPSLGKSASPNTDVAGRLDALKKFPMEDRFDAFVKYSSQYSLPRILFEDFSSSIKSIDSSMSHYPKLTHIINESFMGSSAACMTLAYLKHMRGISHLYNEHNYICHIYQGSRFSMVSSITDTYITLGWKPKGNVSNVISKASLFPFTDYEGIDCQFKILYVTAPIYANRWSYSGEEGQHGETSILFRDFGVRFLKALDDETRSELSYKKYPEKYEKKCMTWDIKRIVSDLIDDEQFVAEGISGRLAIASSELVIIDYQSTAHLESILMNKPTVFFWDEEVYPLDTRYQDFYQKLVEVGVCQVCPNQAAKFIEKIKDDPSGWWTSSEVQSAIKSFVSANFGDSSAMREYLVGCSRGGGRQSSIDPQSSANSITS